MSHSVDEPPEDPPSRPRPSWGQPGPEPTDPTTVLPASGSTPRSEVEHELGAPEPGSSRDQSSSGQPYPGRPSYGQPSHGRPSSGQSSSGQPSYGQPSYGQPGQQPYGTPSAPEGSRPDPSSWAPPAGAPPAWPQQGWGQSGESGYGQPPGWPPPGGPVGWGQPTPSQYGQDLSRHEQAYAQMYGEKPRTGMSIAAMVLGIVAALFAWFPLTSYVAVPLAVLAVIFGVIGVRRQAGRGKAISGIVLGGLALLIAIAASVFWTRLFVDIVQIATDCEDQTGRASGPAFEQCVDERSRDLTPFG